MWVNLKTWWQKTGPSRMAVGSNRSLIVAPGQMAGPAFPSAIVPSLRQPVNPTFLSHTHTQTSVVLKYNALSCLCTCFPSLEYPFYISPALLPSNGPLFCKHLDASSSRKLACSLEAELATLCKAYGSAIFVDPITVYIRLLYLFNFLFPCTRLRVPGGQRLCSSSVHLCVLSP